MMFWLSKSSEYESTHNTLMQVHTLVVAPLTRRSSERAQTHFAAISARLFDATVDHWWLEVLSMHEPLLCAA